MKRFTFFGDSICVGQHLSCCDTWVVQSARNLVDAVGDGLVVGNYSINGNTTRMALERMPFDIQGDGVDVIYIQFGINDSNYWATDGGEPRVQPGAFRENLREMVIRATAFGARQVFLGTNHYTRKDVVVRGASQNHFEESRKYNAIIREVSDCFDHVLLVDHEQAILERCGGAWEQCGQALLEDGIHLSSKGHEFYLDLFTETALSTAIQHLAD